MKNLGQVVASAWAEAINIEEEKIKAKGHNDWLLYLLTDGQIGRKPTVRQQRVREKKWKRQEAIQARKNKKKLAQFVGKIVKVEGDIYNPVLVYADGRKLKIPEWFWERV